MLGCSCRSRCRCGCCVWLLCGCCVVVWGVRVETVSSSLCSCLCECVCCSVPVKVGCKAKLVQVDSLASQVLPEKLGTFQLFVASVWARLRLMHYNAAACPVLICGSNVRSCLQVCHNCPRRHASGVPVLWYFQVAGPLVRRIASTSK